MPTQTLIEVAIWAAIAAALVIAVRYLSRSPPPDDDEPRGLGS